jgi:hypothetical protein
MFIFVPLNNFVMVFISCPVYVYMAHFLLSLIPSGSFFLFSISCSGSAQMRVCLHWPFLTIVSMTPNSVCLF